MTDATLDPALIATSPRTRRVPPRALIVAGAAVIAATAGLWWLNAAPASVTTDNAYLKADKTYVAPRVHGFVAEILVKDNQAVKAGDPLVRLDSEEYSARVASARADVAKADASLASANAALARLDGEIALAAATVREAETGIASANAERARADKDRARYQDLSRKGFAAVQRLETASADAVTAGADAKKAEAGLDVAKGQAAVVALSRAELAAAVQAAQAARAGAAAALDLALQDEGHTLIVAPVDGVVGDRQVERGEYVQPGSRLLAIVPTDKLYVVANFKETQTDLMRPGQRVEIDVDAASGVVLTGTVDSLSPGSGSEFALLPFEPGTGNFTKIVQRIPVRIALDPNTDNLARLRPGLSAEVTVKFEE
ncbi:Colistin resistance protein EmrA [Alphaproteobacteria bacterium SO-S41]|nr:Colistin resistance protein EmrA [Alphaproteobacteria bacterium SO-S41]